MALALYLLVVVPMVGLATAAVWVPRPWQAVLLLGGPLLAVLGALGVPGVERLGWLTVIGVPYLLLVVLPLLPWRREWARTAIPVTALAIAALVVGLSGFDVAIGFYLAFPVLAALGGLGLAALARRDRRARDRGELDGDDPDDPDDRRDGDDRHEATPTGGVAD